MLTNEQLAPSINRSIVRMRATTFLSPRPGKESGKPS